MKDNEAGLEIKLNNLRFYAFHGVLDFERRAGNEFVVNLSVNVKYDRRVEDDNLEGSVSYVDLYEIINEEMHIPRNLLEKVATRIGTRIIEKFPVIVSGWVSIEKTHPPIESMIGSASVVYHF